jgi:UDP-glucuronate decarboxylase
MDKPELSVKEFAEIFNKEGKEIFDYKGKISFNKSDDKDYMTDNPNRRCPNLTKSRSILGYDPTVIVNDGIKRYLEFLHINNGNL